MAYYSKSKKLLNDSYLIWIFPLFLIISCIFLRGISNNYKPDDTTNLRHIYNDKYPDIDTSEKFTAADTSGNNTPDTLHAKYALLMDSDNGRVLFEKNGYEKAPMASTTKIMTLIIALENANVDDIVKVSEYAASMPDVQLNIKKDEQYRLSDLLYSLMLESHNDSAVAIAEHVGGSVEAFAEIMNQKAYELGAYNTHFVTPNGLDHENHYTTAYDLALIAAYAIKNPKFCEIIRTPSYTFHEQTTGRSFTVNNKDRFLTSYPGAIGVKTGFTGKAGYCFVGAIDRDEKHLISVVLASGWPPHKMYKWQDTVKLMDYGINNYNYKDIISQNNNFEKISVTNSIEKGKLTPYCQANERILLSDNEKVSYDIKLPETLEAPVKKDKTIGSITIYIDGVKYKTYPLYSKEGKRRITYSYVLNKIISMYFKNIMI